jgi:eukaryotic-like serine/threonine-protein kinase
MPRCGDAEERARARLGTVLKGKWRLDSILGTGGTACVYGATHRNQSRVAIKMLHPEIAGDPELTARFLREGYVANAVQHPGTVRVLDDDITDDGAPFLVMELLTGETLDARLGRLGRLSSREVVTIADQLLEVLCAAHAHNIVHRDLKPDNLFVTEEGRLKVLDFGIAHLREISSGSPTATRNGSLLGTPAFMPCEQALGHWSEVDTRTDIWSVGATLYTLLSGRFVHEGDTLQKQLVLSATRPARPVRSVAPEVSPELAAVIDRALCFRKTDRWADARAMLDALRTAVAAGSVSPAASHGPSRTVSGSVSALTNSVVGSVSQERRRGGGAVFAILAVLGTLTVGWYATGRWRPVSTSSSLSARTQPARVAAQGGPAAVAASAVEPNSETTGPFVARDHRTQEARPVASTASSKAPVARVPKTARTRVPVRPRSGVRSTDTPPPVADPPSTPKNPFDLRH